MSEELSFLVIEDNLADFLLIERHLQRNGFPARCSRVASIEELSCALDMKSWDVVLSDYSIPQLDFLESFNLLRKRIPDVPVILVSGSIGEEKAVELLKLGICDFVLKDRLGRLVPAIKRSLEEAAERRARRVAEEALRESEDHYRFLFDNMLNGFAYCRVLFEQDRPADFIYLRVNSAFERLTGLKNVVGKKVSEVIPGIRESDPQLFDYYGRVALTGVPERFETYVEALNMWFSVSAYSPKKEYFVALFDVITERKEAEEKRTRVEAQLRQAQKMEALGTLAGGIAHDFNNILGVIIGFTEIARWDAGEKSPLGMALQEVLGATERAKELVQQILAFSRRKEQEKKPVQVGLIVKEAMKMLRASLPSTIEIKLEVDSKAVVLADPTQVHQVLMNLCTNGAHAMREAGGVLDVSLRDFSAGPEPVASHSGLKPGPYVKLVVKDTGHGIDQAILDRIFDPFFTTKELGVGTGLGLSVVHGIVESHGGVIEVDSLPGKGAAFQVYLPAMERAPAPVTAETAALPRGLEKILIVDDEPALAKIMKQMLERLGYEVEFRTNGFEALEIFRLRLSKEPFDLVVTDMTMPRLTGVDLSRELLKLHPGIPILMCTGFSEKINPEEATSLGIQGFLMKPVAVSELAGMIRKALDRGMK